MLAIIQNVDDHDLPSLEISESEDYVKGYIDVSLAGNNITVDAKDLIRELLKYL